MLLGVLNVTGAALFLIKRYLPNQRNVGDLPVIPVAVHPNVRKIIITQTILHWVALAFGISMLVPRLIPGLLVAGILIVNGVLLFRLASNLSRAMTEQAPLLNEGK